VLLRARGEHRAMFIQNNRTSSTGSDVNTKDWNGASYRLREMGLTAETVTVNVHGLFKTTPNPVVNAAELLSWFRARLFNVSIDITSSGTQNATDLLEPVEADSYWERT
jgi:hypothetical protein